jgi:hypothetical protein
LSGSGKTKTFTVGLRFDRSQFSPPDRLSVQYPVYDQPPPLLLNRPSARDRRCDRWRLFVSGQPSVRGRQLDQPPLVLLDRLSARDVSPQSNWLPGAKTWRYDATMRPFQSDYYPGRAGNVHESRRRNARRPHRESSSRRDCRSLNCPRRLRPPSASSVGPSRIRDAVTHHDK